MSADKPEQRDIVAIFNSKSVLNSAVSLLGRYTRLRLREPSALEVILFRSDLGPWPANMDELVQLARKRIKIQAPYAGQVIHSQWKHSGRIYRELVPGVFEDITGDNPEWLADKDNEPKWFQDLKPFEV